jgi:hypothetical protein
MTAVTDAGVEERVPSAGWRSVYETLGVQVPYDSEAER